MPTLPITVPNVFANATSNIALSLLDADFQTVAQAINGIGNGSTPLTNVTITGGTVSGVVVSSVPVSGQCRLVRNSLTQLLLFPVDGQYIQIAGVLYAIPAAGITVGNGGLAALTAYYVYCYNNAGTLALEAIATPNATDTTPGNVGIQIKTGDSSRSFVGHIFTDNASQFRQGDADATGRVYLGVSSWFNRRLVSGSIAISGTAVTTTGNPGANLTNLFTLWPWADEAVAVSTNGTVQNTGGVTPTTPLITLQQGGISVNGTQTSLGAGEAFPIANTFQTNFSAANNFQLFGNSSSGQPVNFTGQMYVMTRM